MGLMPGRALLEDAGVQVIEVSSVSIQGGEEPKALPPARINGSQITLLQGLFKNKEVHQSFLKLSGEEINSKIQENFGVPTIYDLFENQFELVKDWFITGEIPF
jgi:hypothetical protein